MTLKHAFLGVMAASLLAFACDVDRSSDGDARGYYFTGRVFDGVKGSAIAEYTLTLSQAGQEIQTATVTDGVYNVGPLLPGSDYTVTIEADGYRDFYAVEDMKTALPGTDNEQQTDYVEAYLFPTDLASPAVTFELYDNTLATTRPSGGTVRFAPVAYADIDSDGVQEAVSGDSTLNLINTQDPAVDNSYWLNDADTRGASVVSIDFDGSSIAVEEGALVYGVTYEATVYSVDGYSYAPFGFTAGLTGHVTVGLDNLTYGTDDLQLIASTTTTETFNTDGSVTFTFNYPIEYALSSPEKYSKEIIDDGISYVGSVMDDDTTCSLVNDINDDCSDSYAYYDGTLYDDCAEAADDLNWSVDSVSKSERGTEISISENTLTIAWPEGNRDNAFETEADGTKAGCDSGDVTTVVYDLGDIAIRPVDSIEANAATLASLLGSQYLTVSLKEPSAH